MFGRLLRFLSAYPPGGQSAASLGEVVLVGEVRTGVYGDHDGQVGHGGRPAEGRGVVRPFGLRLGVLRAAAFHLNAYLVAVIADGDATAGVGRYVRSRAKRRPVGGEVGRRR